jgi:hypothetical protein
VTSTRTVVLPSGRRVRVRIDPRARVPKREKSERGLFADVLALLVSDRLVVEDAKTSARLDAAAIDALPLRDFHVLRDLAIRAHLIRGETEVIPCDNCDAELSFDPASLPIEDLDDRYEDEEPAEEHDVALPSPLVIEKQKHASLRMRPVTVAEARALWRELGRDRPFRIAPKLLAAMGVVRAGSISDLRLVAKALDRADDDTWSAVEAAFLDLAYPPRAIASITCAACETVHDLEVPWPRELEPGQYRKERDPSATFPSEDELEKRARAIADATFRAMNAGGLALRVERGVPEVDAGGVPMLGSYAPEPRDDGGTDFVVRVYYRTFERAFRDDATFDWEHELEETIEHEAQHHLYYLSGHDPMDAQERAESERDLVRRVGGEKRYRKLQRRALFADVWEILRVLVPAIGLVVLAVLVLSRCAS